MAEPLVNRLRDKHPRGPGKAGNIAALVVLLILFLLCLYAFFPFLFPGSKDLDFFLPQEGSESD